ncbi:hypothetical protein V6Z11_D03G140300 [Gossypium hirsutum]
MFLQSYLVYAGFYQLTLPMANIVIMEFVVKRKRKGEYTPLMVHYRGILGFVLLFLRRWLIYLEGYLL